MTGDGIKRYFSQVVDTAYSGYLDDTKLNRLFQNAFINTVQNIYTKRLTNQSAFDDISYLIATEQVFDINQTTNTMYLGTHYIPLISIFNVGTAVTVTSGVPHDLLTGTRITFRNVTGTGNITVFNGQTYSVTVVDAVTFTLTASFVNTGVFASGEITFPDSILDYDHYLWGQARFNVLTDFTVDASTNASPIKITLNKRSYLRTGDQIAISGIAGNTNANGTFYLRQANEFEYFLYSDQKLRTPIAGNGVQTGVGVVREILINNLKFKRSDEKGTVYGQPTVELPFFQQSKNLIRILPDEPCDQLTMDYIRTSPIVIDVTNTTTDLDNYFTPDFQYTVINEAAKLFAESIRDNNLMGTATLELRDQQ